MYRIHVYKYILLYTINCVPDVIFFWSKLPLQCYNAYINKTKPMFSIIRFILLVLLVVQLQRISD